MHWRKAQTRSKTRTSYNAESRFQPIVQPMPYRVSKKAKIDSQRSDYSPRATVCFVWVDSSISALFKPARLRLLRTPHFGPCHTRTSRDHGRTPTGPNGTVKNKDPGVRHPIFAVPFLGPRTHPASRPRARRKPNTSSLRSRHERESHFVFPILPVAIRFFPSLFRLQIRHLPIPLRHLTGQPLFGIAQLPHHGQNTFRLQ